jgi:hypothetical protein
MRTYQIVTLSVILPFFMATASAQVVAPVVPPAPPPVPTEIFCTYQGPPTNPKRVCYPVPKDRYKVPVPKHQ